MVCGQLNQSAASEICPRNDAFSVQWCNAESLSDRYGKSDFDTEKSPATSTGCPRMLRGAVRVCMGWTLQADCLDLHCHGRGWSAPIKMQNAQCCHASREKHKSVVTQNLAEYGMFQDRLIWQQSYSDLFESMDQHIQGRLRKPHLP